MKYEPGYCQCGCGGQTVLASQTRRGYIKGEPMRFIHGHHLRTAEYKARLFTEERSDKLRAAHADGRIPKPTVRRGVDSPSWRGAQIGYTQAHIRVVKERGDAAHYLCEACGANAHEWAIDHAHRTLQFGTHAGRLKPYSADTSAYVPLCRSCHRSADRRGGYRCLPSRHS